jgi:hypothetical protein
MPDDKAALWVHPPKRRELAQAFGTAELRLTAKELGVAVRTHPSNVLRHLRELLSAGLISAGPSDAAQSRRGPTPQAFWLTSDQKAVADQALSAPPAPAHSSPTSTRRRSSRPTRTDPALAPLHKGTSSRHAPTMTTPPPEPGALARGQVLLFARAANGALADILQTLSDASAQAESALWVATIGDEVAFAFADQTSAAPLLSVLHGAKVVVRHAVVVDVCDVGRLIDTARIAAPHARRARLNRSAHDAV